MATAPAGRDYADGSVVEISAGSAELEDILRSAQSRHQLVLLDFSVSWCGPCRALAPVLAQLAQEHRGKVVVAKMDCEKSPGNQSLAADNAISAYPTLKLFRDRRAVATLRGANPPALRQAIAEQLSQLGGAHDPPGVLASALASALAHVKNNCSFPEFLAAAKALLVYVGNVLQHPEDLRYRRVRLANAGYQSKLGSKPGGRRCMEVLGFVERSEAMDAVFVMDQVHPQLASVMTLLQQAVAAGERGSSGAGAASPAPAPGPPPAATPVPVPATAAAAPAAAEVPPAQPAGGSGGRRQVVVTPVKLARLLEKAMLDSGIGAPPPS